MLTWVCLQVINYMSVKDKYQKPKFNVPKQIKILKTTKSEIKIQNVLILNCVNQAPESPPSPKFEGHLKRIKQMDKLEAQCVIWPTYHSICVKIYYISY